jgi:hypothetical protein
VNKLEAVPVTPDPWESGELGRDPTQAECAPPELKLEIDAAIAMQPISIRLQKDLLAELKLIADYRGIGYQPLIRDILGRFARSELMTIARELQEEESAKQIVEQHQSALKSA